MRVLFLVLTQNMQRPLRWEPLLRRRVCVDRLNLQPFSDAELPAWPTASRIVAAIRATVRLLTRPSRSVTASVATPRTLQSPALRAAQYSPPDVFRLMANSGEGLTHDLAKAYVPDLEGHPKIALDLNKKLGND